MGPTTSDSILCTNCAGSRGYAHAASRGREGSAFANKNMWQNHINH